MREVEEHNIDHTVFRSWSPPCVKGRAEAHGHTTEKDQEKRIPVIGIDCMHMHSEQEKGEEKGMPIIVTKDSRTKAIVSKVATSKGVVDYAIGVVKRTIEQLG